MALLVNICVAIIGIALIAGLWDKLDEWGAWPFVFLAAIGVVIAFMGGMEGAIIWFVMIGGCIALAVTIVLVIKACGGLKED